MRRVYTFRSEGLDYDAQVKLRTLRQFTANGYLTGRDLNAACQLKIIEHLIAQTKVKAERLVADLDVLRAVARDLRDVVRSGDPATTEDHDADQPRREKT